MTSKRSSKPSAQDRTVDLFSGKSTVDLAAEAERCAANEDVQDPVKDREEKTPIEEANANRDHVLKVTDWTTDTFPLAPEEGVAWRITHKRTKEPWKSYYLLEKVTSDGKAIAAWSGMVIPEHDIYGLADVVVKAARERKAREGK